MQLCKFRSATVSLLLLGMTATTTLFAQDNSRHTIPNSKFGFATTANDLGPEQTTKQITIYVWLQLHNADALQELVEQQYDPSSANYQNWLTADQFSSTYAPSAEDVATVKGFLAAHNLGVLSVGEQNMYVKAQGSIADVQAAFSVQIHKFDVRGQTYRGNATDPVMAGPAGALVSRVGGLSDFHLQPHVVRHVNPTTGKPLAAVPLSAAPNGAFFSPSCLQGFESENFSTDGSSPKASYFGNAYGAPITNTNLGTLAPCGYQPSDLQTAYGLNALYNIGLTGKNQTVVIVDAYGSPTIGTDASAYASFYGLAPLDLTVIPLGLSCAASAGTNLALCQGWATETSLDVESAHAVAPGANVVLIEAASDYDDDLNAAILYAVANGLGNVISNSYGEPESQEGLPSNDPFGTTLLIAAAEGISVDFSSGDYGDWSLIEGYTDVSYPASSPYATAVGGTSLFLNHNLTMAFQTGWGDNFTEIANPTDVNGYSTPLVPPDSSPTDGLGFAFGSGGGRSGVFRKPSFQNGLPGRARLVPDISYLADPQTGIEFFCTGASCFNNDPNDIYFSLVGGTSLSCPMFSSLWAIANQRSGRPLGQAARSIYSLPPNAIYDVVPVNSPFDATGSITVGHRTTYENPFQLVMPETPTPFLSALTEGGDGSWYVISFGTDTSLSTGWGWDNVTGLGTPNGLDFVYAVTPHW
jgi:subtilase family serine protease